MYGLFLLLQNKNTPRGYPWLSWQLSDSFVWVTVPLQLKHVVTVEAAMFIEPEGKHVSVHGWLGQDESFKNPPPFPERFEWGLCPLSVWLLAWTEEI